MRVAAYPRHPQYSSAITFEKLICQRQVQEIVLVGYHFGQPLCFVDTRSRPRQSIQIRRRRRRTAESIHVGMQVFLRREIGRQQRQHPGHRGNNRVVTGGGDVAAAPAPAVLRGLFVS